MMLTDIPFAFDTACHRSCLMLILILDIHSYYCLYPYLFLYITSTFSLFLPLPLPLPLPYLISHHPFLEHPSQIIGILDTAKASYENIFVGGFSQGGCLSLHMIRSELVTKLPEQLKGIFSMGSFLVSKSVVLQEERMISKKGNMLLDIPIFMMHGILILCHNRHLIVIIL